jgi:hypothetical protein
MAEMVKLTNKDLELVITASQLVVDYKYRALAKPNWISFEKDYLPKLITALDQNQFKVATSSDGILVWLMDQIIHSKRVVDGIPKKDWIPLTDLDIIQETLSILRHASRGQNVYDTHRKQSSFGDLFD